MVSMKSICEPEVIGVRCVAAIGLFASIIGYAHHLPNVVLAAFCAVVSLILLFHMRNNRALLLISFTFLYTCYSILYANYLVPITTSPYIVYRDSTAATVALSAFLLFLSCIVLMLPSRITRYSYGDPFPAKGKENAVIVLCILAVLLLVVVFGFKSADATTGRGSQTALFEYSTILFPVAFYFCGKSTPLRVATLILLVTFCARGLMAGERIAALQLILLVFFLFLSEKMRTKTMIFLMLVGLAFFTVIGPLRAGIGSASIQDIVDTLSITLETGLAWDTAYSSWHTSITFILYGDLIDAGSHMALFGQWVLSVFFGNSVPESQLPQITCDYFWHMYGGITPVYFQFYLGALGVVLIAVLVSLILRLINRSLYGNSNASPVAVICSVYATISVFRWVLYSPSQITRGLLLCLLFTAICFWIDASMRRKEFLLLGCHRNCAHLMSESGR